MDGVALDRLSDIPGQISLYLRTEMLWIFYENNACNLDLDTE